MSKNINKEELDRILTDIYDTEVPKEKRFSFSTEGLAEKIREKEQHHEKADVISVSHSRKNMLRRITAMAASAAIMAGIGTMAMRNIQMPFEKDGGTSDESSVSQVTTAVSETHIADKYNGPYYKFEKLEYQECYFLEALSSEYFVMRGDTDENGDVQFLYRMDYDNFKLEKISENYGFDNIFEVSAEGNPYLVSAVHDNNYDNELTGTEVFRIAQDGSRERMSWEKTVTDGCIDNGIMTGDGRSVTFETEFLEDYSINVRIDFHDAEGNVIDSESVAERVFDPYLKFYTSSSGKLIALVEYRNDDVSDFENFFYTVDYDNQKIEYLIQTERKNVYDGYGKYDFCFAGKNGEKYSAYGICIDDGSIEKIDLPDNPDPEIENKFYNADYEKRMDDGTVFLFYSGYVLKATPCSAEEFDYTELYNTVYGESCSGKIVFETEEAVERYGTDGFVSMLEKRMKDICLRSDGGSLVITYNFEADYDSGTVTMEYITLNYENIDKLFSDYLSGKNNFTIRKGDSEDGEILFTNSDIENASAGYENDIENDKFKRIINIRVTEEAAAKVNDIENGTVVSAWLDGKKLTSAPVSGSSVFSSDFIIDMSEYLSGDETGESGDSVTAWKMVSEPVDFDIRVVSSDIRCSDDSNQ